MSETQPPPPPEKDYYKSLRVPPTATAAEIKKGYRELARKYHPDLDPKNEEMFKEITAAYNELSDKEKRGKYDRRREMQPPETHFAPPPHDPSLHPIWWDSFDNLAGGGHTIGSTGLLGEHEAQFRKVFGPGGLFAEGRPQRQQTRSKPFYRRRAK